jgi:hypothetical protein
VISEIWILSREIHGKTHPHKLSSECFAKVLSIWWEKANSIYLVADMFLYDSKRAGEDSLKVNYLVRKSKAFQ